MGSQRKPSEAGGEDMMTEIGFVSVPDVYAGPYRLQNGVMKEPKLPLERATKVLIAIIEEKAKREAAIIAADKPIYG